MTYEEFKALAMNPPYNYEPVVYRIDVFRIQEPDNGKSRVTICAEYKVCKSQSFIMPTFEDAEAFIKSDQLSVDDDRPIYCIHIYELPFGKDVISDMCKREWVFDGECNLVNQSACSSLIEDFDNPEGHFWGRPEESIRFKRGDIVEVHDRQNGIVRLAVIVSLHNDIDTCWRDYQDTVRLCEIEGVGVEFADENYCVNALDDYYEVVDDSGEHNLSDAYTTDVFAPRVPISAQLKTHLNKCYSIAITHGPHICY